MGTMYYTLNGKLRCAVLVVSCSGQDYTNYTTQKQAKKQSNFKK